MRLGAGATLILTADLKFEPALQTQARRFLPFQRGCADERNQPCWLKVKTYSAPVKVIGQQLHACEDFGRFERKSYLRK